MRGAPATPAAHTDARARRAPGRLREELGQASEAARSEAQRAGRAAESQRLQHLEQERALRAQLQGAEQELAACRAALAAAEQRVASLDAAVQQSNGVAMSLTTKIAQSMADGAAQVSLPRQQAWRVLLVAVTMIVFGRETASAWEAEWAWPQVDALRAKVQALEQAAAEAQRREAELKAEVSMLTGNITAMQQRHAQVRWAGGRRKLHGGTGDGKRRCGGCMQELEAARQRVSHEAQARLSGELAAAEERGRAAAAAAAQAERTQLQEQVAFLKAQLQFALKVWRRERADGSCFLTGPRSQQALTARLGRWTCAGCVRAHSRRSLRDWAAGRVRVLRCAARRAGE